MPDDTDDDRYTGEITLAWEGDEIPPEDAPAKVVEDIRKSLGALDKPGDLIFHNVRLTDDWNGPSVHVYGVEGDPAFHCVYHSITKWRTTDEWKKTA